MDKLTTPGQRVLIALFLIAVFFVFGALHLMYGIYMMSDVAIIAMLFGGLCEIYSMILGFTIFLTWQQFDRISMLVMQEAGALGNVLHFGSHLNAEAYGRIVAAMDAYATDGVRVEWDQMKKGKRSPETQIAFDVIYDAVLVIQTQSEGEGRIVHHLMRMLEQAGMYRYERLALGIGHIPRMMMVYVFYITGALLTLLALHTASTPAELVVTTIFASVSFFGLWVVYDLDHPFTGAWAISSQPLEDLARKEVMP